MKRSPLKRKTPLRKYWDRQFNKKIKVPPAVIVAIHAEGKKIAATLERKRLRRVNPQRAAENAAYRKAAGEFLRCHPLCQYAIAQLGFDEAKVLLAYFSQPKPFTGWFRYKGHNIPPSDDVHHRAGRIGARLLDQRWWLAVWRFSHDMIEGNLGLARAEGFALPVQADDDGRWGVGNQALPTPELMKSKIRP